MLAQPLCGRDGATKECFLGITSGQKLAFIPRKTYDDVHVELLERKKGTEMLRTAMPFLALPVRRRIGDHMDLAPIGAHCSLPSCRALDLLPIRCRCDLQFCKDHIFPDTHDCPVDPSQALRDDETPPTLQKRLQRCSLASCNKPSLDAFVGDSAGDGGRVSALCARCKLGYCAACVPFPPSLHISSSNTILMQKPGIATHHNTPVQHPNRHLRPRTKPPTHY